MQRQDESERAAEREAREAAYRRGWVQSGDETVRLVLQLIEMGYSPTEIRRLYAAYNDHYLMKWRQEGDLTRKEDPPAFDMEQCQEILKRGGYDWIV